MRAAITRMMEDRQSRTSWAWRLARSSNGTLYAVVARRSEDGSIGNAGDGALYRSTDGAEHWVPVSLPDGTNAPNGLAIDPESPERLYLAAWARATGEHGDGGGVFLSENGGKSWKQVLDKDRHIVVYCSCPNDVTAAQERASFAGAWPDREAAGEDDVAVEDSLYTAGRRGVGGTVLVEKIAGVRLKRSYKLDAPKGVRGRNSDNTLIKKLMNWAPSIRLEDGMEKTYKWIHDEMTSGKASVVNALPRGRRPTR